MHLLPGKTTESSRYGMAAGAADDEQNLLKLKMLHDDYAADLKQLAGHRSCCGFIPCFCSGRSIIAKVLLLLIPHLMHLLPGTMT